MDTEPDGKDNPVKEQLKLHTILRHIQGVQANCNELAFRLAANGENDFARQLIANGLLHDNSKLSGIEWEFLHDDVSDELFQEALEHHRTTNEHHPEFWGADGIHDMPRIYVAEMVCDWKQRSSEFGSDLMEWIDEKAKKKWNFDCRDKAGKEIRDFTKLLLDKRFS